jgi:3-deoxy-D-manno-octulosonate 8-phosphate phosphatase (KDO 8-P phosphatase)
MTCCEPALSELSRDALLERAARVQLAVFDVDGVLTDGRLHYGDDGREIKAFCAQDGLGIKYIQQIGITVAVITGRESPIVAHRMSELGVDHVYQRRKDKRETFDNLLGALGLTNEQVAYTGDDLIDLPLITRSGLGIAVLNAHPLVLPHADWVTPRPGGFGAARDVCDLLLEGHGRMDELVASLVDDG